MDTSLHNCSDFNISKGEWFMNSCNTSGSVLVVGYTSTLAQLLTRLKPELKIKLTSYSHYVICHHVKL